MTPIKARTSLHQRYYPWLISLQVIIDFLTIFIGFLLGYWIWLSLKNIHQNYQPLSIFIPYALVSDFILVMYLRHFKLYERQSGLLNIYEITGIIKSFLFGVMTILAFSFFYREVEFSRLATIFSFSTSFLLLNIQKPLYKKIWRKYFSNSKFAQNILIYGAGVTGRRLAHKILKHPRLGYHVIGFIDDDPEKFKHQDDILGKFENLGQIFHDNECSYLFIAMPHLTTDTTLEVIQTCQENQIPYRIVPPTYETYLEHIQIEDIDGIPLVGIKDKISRRFLFEKRLFDMALSLIGLLLVLPLFPLIILWIKKESSGPAIFIQDRVGMNGKIFKMYKFRTMHTDAPQYEWTPNDLNDPRITKVGQILRRASLDELPQLWNVLKGDMSFVGPRPEMPFIVDTYNALQRERLKIKPGITGLWQISGDRNLQIHENLEYDLYYIEHQSLLMDMVIILKTCLSVFGLRGL